jgi:hypothetical protein
MVYQHISNSVMAMHDGPSQIARPIISWVDLSNDEVF